MYGIHRYGEDAPTYGKKMKDETKDKIREANLGRIIPEEQIKKMSISQIKRWKDPNLKNERSVKYKELGIRPPSPKGLLWWNNDKICKRAKDKPGEDFKLGRLINVTKTK
jgi:hypothetical protein